MPSGRRPVARRPRPAGGRVADAGFTMVEVLMAIAMIGVISTALTVFFVSTVSAAGRQATAQVAIQLATDGAERVRSVKGSALPGGRDKISSDAQWADPVAGIGSYLTGMEKVWDGTAVYPDGATAPLPTSPRIITLNNVTYYQSFYLGKCWQPPAGGDCVAAPDIDAVGYFRAVVAVTWDDRRCTGGTCSYALATLVTTSSKDPVFNSNETAQAPTVTNPGAQAGDVSVPVSLQVVATGGAPPLTWFAASLPPGLVMTSAGLISGTPTTPGTYPVVVSSTDGFTLTGTAAFSWKVNPLPVLTTPGAQTSAGGTALSLTVPLTGGTAPLVWSVTAPGPWGLTGLPPGLSINAGTGVISGAPTTVGAVNPVTVTVTDTYGKKSSVTFNWTVPALAAKPVAAQAGSVTATITALPLAATGGILPYAWSVTGLPPGLAMTTAGVISGKPTTGSRFVVAATVTDKAGTTATVTFAWAVATTSLAITAPSTDRIGDLHGQPVSFTAAVANLTGGAIATWSATGLPAGVALGATGVISGTPTQAGTYLVTLSAVDSKNKTRTAVCVFTWTIT